LAILMAMLRLIVRQQVRGFALPLPVSHAL
jgi:hypothetical protein